MMMTVHAVNHLDGHSEKSGSFPIVDASLHQPSRCGVSQRMRRDVAFKLRQSRGGLECGLHRLDGLAIPLDEIVTRDSLVSPTAKVREQAGRDRNRWLALVRFALPLGEPIENASLKVDKRPALTLVRRSRGDRAGACPSVEANQDEASQVA